VELLNVMKFAWFFFNYFYQWKITVMQNNCNKVLLKYYVDFLNVFCYDNVYVLQAPVEHYVLH